MKGSDWLRVVDTMHHEKNIPRELIFEALEAGIQLAAEKHYGELETVVVSIDRDTGEIHARRGEETIDPKLLGRIAAQAAKQVLIQKLRDAESNEVFNTYAAMKGDLVHGTVTRHEGGACIVSLGKSEAILPRGEQIPGETHHVGERIKAVVLDVKRAGHRVKVILSRTHPDFVRRLFENEIPEISDGTISIRALAREAGYRAKVAVSSIDLKVDCVGACVGVRGSRIKNVVDELSGERIDIVRWNDSMQVMIPNALQPAQIEEVFLYSRLGRAIVLVKEDQLSLAIGRRGQNVRLASKLSGWDLEIMTHEELDESIAKAESWFSQLPHVSSETLEALITEGFLSYDDLTFLEPSELAELAAITEEEAEEVIAFAEEAAERVEEETRAAKAAEAQARAAAQAAGIPYEGDAVPTPAAPAVDPAKQTFESLFRDLPADSAPEQQYTAEQVLGEPVLAEAEGEAVEGEPAAVSEPAPDVTVSEQGETVEETPPA